MDEIDVLIALFPIIMFFVCLFMIISRLNNIKHNTELTAKYISKMLDLDIENRFVMNSNKKRN